MSNLRPKAFAALAALLCAAPAGATKLDLTSVVDIKAANYGHLLYKGDRSSQGLYSERASLGFVIKGIRLEKAPQSDMEVGVVLQSVGSGSSTSSVTAPQFAEASARLPQDNGTPFLRNAYVRVKKFIAPNVTATFGRQDFTLGQGITLSSEDVGLPGGRLEIDNAWRGVKAELFYFRPFYGGTYSAVYGALANYQASEGTWQVYHLLQRDTSAGTDVTFNTASKTKKFTGIRYLLQQKQLAFDGEAVVQRGEAAKLAGGKFNYLGHAFMMNGAWTQDIGVFGRSRLRLGYGRSSGNPGTNATTDKAFFPAFGRKHEGLERSGYGEIAGASLYDIIKTSGTVNGLPDGVSGLNVITAGADLGYRDLLFSFDIYKFRATSNANGGSLQVAGEYDFKVTYPLGDNLKLRAVYAVFTPLGLYPDTEQIKLAYGAVSAKF